MCHASAWGSRGSFGAEARFSLLAMPKVRLEHLAEGQPVGKAKAGDVKSQAKNAVSMIALDDSDDDCIMERSTVAIPASQVAKKESSLKKEIKAEKQPPKAKKKHKVKREKPKETDEKVRSARSRSRGKEKKNKDKGKERKKQATSSEKSEEESTEEELSEGELYKRFKPFTKIMVVNLVRKADLNGMNGTVVHPNTSVCPCPPGCVLVRLETGREIAIKPPNIQIVTAFQKGPMSIQSQTERLRQVIKTIKQNVDGVLGEHEYPDMHQESCAILGDSSTAQSGGVGHIL